MRFLHHNPFNFQRGRTAVFGIFLGRSIWCIDIVIGFSLGIDFNIDEALADKDLIDFTVDPKTELRSTPSETWLAEISVSF